MRELVKKNVQRIAVLSLVALFLIAPGSTSLAAPRTEPERDHASERQKVLAVVASVLMLEIAVAGGFDAIEKVGDLIFIAMAFTVFAVISYMLMYWRIAAYGAMLTGSFLVASLFGPDPGAVAFTLSGTVAVAAGLVTLRAFMRRYPVLAMEE